MHPRPSGRTREVPPGLGSHPMILGGFTPQTPETWGGVHAQTPCFGPGVRAPPSQPGQPGWPGQPCQLSGWPSQPCRPSQTKPAKATETPCCFIFINSPIRLCPKGFLLVLEARCFVPQVGPGRVPWGISRTPRGTLAS